MTLLNETPELAVIIDTFEQRVQRSKDRVDADAHYSGKKKQHTLKSQLAVNEETGEICDVADSVLGPTADITVLKELGLLSRLPEGVGGIGDLAYIGIAEAHPQHLGATPRRKPRGKERPPEDVASIGPSRDDGLRWSTRLDGLRRYQCLSQIDRHHRQNHTPRGRGPWPGWSIGRFGHAVAMLAELGVGAVRPSPLF